MEVYGLTSADYKVEPCLRADGHVAAGRRRGGGACAEGRAPGGDAGGGAEEGGGGYSGHWRRGVCTQAHGLRFLSKPRAHLHAQIHHIHPEAVWDKL